MSQQRTVLIVDDSPEDREVYQRYLRGDREFQYRFIQAELGEDGLELYHNDQPDVVLVDYFMLDLDGLEFITRLKTQTQQLSLPVIVVTGEGNEAIAVQCMKAGAQDYLVKGQITPESLRFAIEGTIETVQLQAQLQQRIERERVIGQISQQIHQSLDLNEILHTTVEAVRQFLHTDRVIVFRLEPNSQGTVIAESVGTSWRSLLSLSIYEPCLGEKYHQSHPQQLARVNTNIEQDEITPCYAELLKPFQVKANLVVPILHDDQLWGMLIAHHCASPRLWQPLEIDLLQQLATQLGIAIRQAELYQKVQHELADRKQTEEVLRQSEEFKRRILENSTDCIKLLDLEGRLLYMNGGGMGLMEIEDLTAYRHKEWVSFWSMEAQPEAQQAIAAAQSGEIGKFQGFCPTSTGKPKWWDVLITPILNSQGQVVELLSVSRDVTERKQTEEALRESEERFRTLANNMSQFAWMADANGWIFWYNSRWFEYTGTTLEEMQGWGWQAVHHPNHLDRVVQRIRHSFETGELWEDTFPLRGKDGVYRWFLSRAIPIKDYDGQIVCWFGTNTDIDDRKRAEEALAESEARYRQLANTVPNIVWSTDAEGRTEFVNQRWTEYTGLTLEDALEWRWLQVIHQEDLPPIQKLWRSSFSQPSDAFTYEIQCRFRAADGLYRWNLVCGYPIRDEKGEILKWFGTCTDIHDRVMLEVERDRLLVKEQAAREEAERANRIKDEFLAILSHELRSPLNPILGWTKLLQTRQFDALKTAEALAIIERNAKLQTQLIDDLLDVAKILRGKLSLNVVPVDLTRVIEAALDTVKTAASAKSIMLHPILGSSRLVSGDAVRLQQIVWNLLSNAVKFTPRGGRVDIELKQSGDYAQITVTDTGKGISPNFLPYIFESFRQEDLSITRQYGGLGLGLAIVRHLIEAHGGTVAAKSPGEGQGATFTVQLPLLNVKSAINPTDKPAEDEPDLKGIRVLTVDDDPDSRELVAVLLSQYGADVMTVPSATEALIALESFNPNLLVSDIGMPDVDGYTLLRQVRSLPPERGGEIPAIALTAYAGESNQGQALDCGFQEHIPKPIEPDQFIKAVVRQVSIRHQQILQASALSSWS